MCNLQTGCMELAGETSEKVARESQWQFVAGKSGVTLSESPS